MSRRKAGLGFILVTLFLDILGIGLVIPILPKLLESFVGHNTVDATRYYGWLMASYALMQFFFSPVLGSLSDRFGRRPILLLSVFGQASSYLLLAFAPNLFWLFVGRLIAGLFGASIGTATAYIADVSAPEKRAQNFGLVGMAFGLGFIAGPLIGGLLGGISAKLPFLAAAGLALTNVVYGLFVLPESLGAEHRRPFSWTKANPAGTMLSLRRYRSVAGLVGSVFFIYLAQAGLESIWVLYVGHRYLWDVRAAGLSLAVVGLSNAVVQGGLVRRIIPALGERRTLLFGMAVGVLAFIAYGSASVGWLIYPIAVFNSLSGLMGPAVQAIMSKEVSANEQGLLQGGVMSMQSLTRILGPLIASSAFGYFISDRAPVKVPGMSFFVGAGFIFIALLLAVRFFGRHPENAPGVIAVPAK